MVKKPTTVEGWLKTLPEPLRSSAISQCDCLDSTSGSLLHSLENFADWDTTKERYEYWEDVCAWAESKEG
jgi:hypothetical protein